MELESKRLWFFDSYHYAIVEKQFAVLTFCYLDNTESMAWWLAFREFGIFAKEQHFHSGKFLNF